MSRFDQLCIEYVQNGLIVISTEIDEELVVTLNIGSKIPIHEGSHLGRVYKFNSKNGKIIERVLRESKEYTIDEACLRLDEIATGKSIGVFEQAEAFRKESEQLEKC